MTPINTAMTVATTLGEKKSVFSVSLPPSLRDFADEHAKANRISRSAVIAHALMFLKLSVARPDDATTPNHRSVRYPQADAPVSQI